MKHYENWYDFQQNELDDIYLSRLGFKTYGGRIFKITTEYISKNQKGTRIISHNMSSEKMFSGGLYADSIHNLSRSDGIKNIRAIIINNALVGISISCAKSGSQIEINSSLNLVEKRLARFKEATVPEGYHIAFINAGFLRIF